MLFHSCGMAVPLLWNSYSTTVERPFQSSGAANSLTVKHLLLEAWSNIASGCYKNCLRIHYEVALISYTNPDFFF